MRKNRRVGGRRVRVGGQTIKDGEQEAAVKEGGWKMDVWIEGGRASERTRWQEKKEK